MAASLKRWEDIAKLVESMDCGKASIDLARYRDDPALYAEEILKVKPTPDQRRIMQAILEPPYRVLVPAGHNVGKTFVSSAILLWFVHTQGPSAIINSTAPSYQALAEVLWGQIRDMDSKAGLGMFRTSATPIIRFGPMHYAKGMTADKMGSFTGRHALRNAFIVDEAIDVTPKIYPVIESMMAGDRYFTLMIYNPVDPSSPLRLMEESGQWTVIRLSQATHPNIEAGRRGESPPYPSAVTLEKHEQELIERSEPVIGEPMPGDVFVGWKYGADGEKVGGEWRRPNYEACCRNLGRWPDQSSVSIWTPRLFQEALDRDLPDTGLLQIGIDVARYGSCNTSFAVRRGGNLLHVESYNGWNTTQISERARELCFEYGGRYKVPPREVPVAIDSTGGWGAGVEDQAEHHNFIPVVAGEKAIDDTRYYLIRDELWCGLREHAEAGGVSFKKAPKSVIDIIRPQALAAKYEYRGTRKKVLPKEDMAEMLSGRSPDEFESVLLAFANVTGIQHRERVAGRVV